MTNPTTRFPAAVLKPVSGSFGALAMAASPAMAHHPLAGAPMETFTHGVLSGIGHPILGFDHLFFIVLVGIAATLVKLQFKAPLAYIGAMALGCLVISTGFALPMVEFVVGLSLLALGVLVASGRSVNAVLMLAVFALAGLFHGAAFGGTIADQESGAGLAVLAGYLIGLAAVQYAIAIAAGMLLKVLSSTTETTLLNARLAGAVVAGVGVFLTLEHLEGAAFAVLGLG